MNASAPLRLNDRLGQVRGFVGDAGSRTHAEVLVHLQTTTPPAVVPATAQPAAVTVRRAPVPGRASAVHLGASLSMRAAVDRRDRLAVGHISSLRGRDDREARHRSEQRWKDQPASENTVQIHDSATTPEPVDDVQRMRCVAAKCPTVSTIGAGWVRSIRGRHRLPPFGTIARTRRAKP